MMLVEHDTGHFEIWYDGRYGIGFVRRKADGAQTQLITDADMVELRRQLNRIRTNASSKRKFHRPFNEIADCLLSEYFLLPPEEVVP